MTANHARTPTATQIREDYAHLRYHFADGWSIGEERVQFDNWLTAEIAAAEQRGAIKALTDFRRFAYRVMPGEVQSKHVIADINIALKRLHNDNHLLMGPLSADKEAGNTDE